VRNVIEGFLRFQQEEFPKRAALFKHLASNQTPQVLFIACSDSRVVPELLTQRGPGDLFVIRNAGNIVPSHGASPGGVSASVEYAVTSLGVRDIVICGHSDCGAMSAIAACTCLDHMPAVANWLRYADAAKVINAAQTHASPAHRLRALTRQNVEAQLANIKTHPCVALALQQGTLSLHGWVFDIESGHIDALDSRDNRFVSLAEHPEVHA